MAGYTPITTPTPVTNPTRTAANGIFSFTDPTDIPSFETSEQRRARFLAEADAYGAQAGRLVSGAEQDVENLRKYSQQLLTGQIPADVSEAVRKASVAAGMQRGVARGQMGRGLTARDLGLTSMQLREQGAATAAQAAGLGLSQAEFAQRQREFGISTAEEARRFDVTTQVGAEQFNASLTVDQRKFFADLSNNINQFNITTSEGIRQFTESMSAEESRFARNLLENVRQFNTQTELQNSQFYAQLNQNEQQFVRQLFQNRDQFEKDLAQRQLEFQVTAGFEELRIQQGQQQINLQSSELLERSRQFDLTLEQSAKQFVDSLNFEQVKFAQSLAEEVRQFDSVQDMKDSQFYASLSQEGKLFADELAQKKEFFAAELNQRTSEFAAQLQLQRDELKQKSDQFDRDLDLRIEQLKQEAELQGRTIDLQELDVMARIQLQNEQFALEKEKTLTELGINLADLDLRATKLREELALEGRRVTVDEARAIAEIEARAIQLQQTNRQLDIQEATELAEAAYRLEELSFRTESFALSLTQQQIEFSAEYELSQLRFNEAVKQAEQEYSLKLMQQDLSEAQFKQAQNEFDTKMMLAVNEQIVDLTKFGQSLQYNYSATKLEGDASKAKGPLDEIKTLQDQLFEIGSDIQKESLVRVGNETNQAARLALQDFSWKTYIASYPDLQNAGIDTREEAENHFLNYGYFEGRRKY